MAGPGEAHPRIALKHDGGGIHFGNGSATPEVVISRPATGVLDIRTVAGQQLFAVDTDTKKVWLTRGQSGFAGSESFRIVRAVKTTNATDTEIARITLADLRAYYIVVRVVGRKPSGSIARAFFYKAAMASREGGGASVESSQPNVTGPITAGTASSWGCDFTTSGNDVLVRVKGESADVYWVATVEYQSVSTDS